MLVIAPITWMYVRDDMITERLVLNEVAQFIDKTTDKATITQQDIDDLYIAVNASGGTYDVEVNRYVSTPTPSDVGDSRMLYSNVDYLDVDGKPLDLIKGDVIKVTAEEIGLSPAKKLLWTLLRVDSGSSKITLAGSVR